MLMGVFDVIKHSILCVNKRCPHCKKLIVVDVIKTDEDGEDADEMNTEVKLTKFHSKS